ncbi:MAG: hypothetical protein ACR2M0_09270 [Chloroflexia bacterium]
MSHISYTPRRAGLLGLLMLALLPALAGCDIAAPTGTPIPATTTATELPPTSLPPTQPPAIDTAAPQAPATDTASPPTAAPTDTPLAPPPTAAPSDTVPAPTVPEPTATNIPDLATVTPVPPAETPTTAPPVPTAPPVTPTPPPSSGTGRIVFVLDNELAVVNSDGSGLTRLGVKGDITSPRWSPDKTRIVYLLGYGVAADLWVVHGDGSSLHRLTNTPGIGESEPQWSPDGRTLAYTRTADTNGDKQLDTRDTSAVWLIGADGTSPHRLADGMDPAWAPDGKRLAFATAGKRTADNPYGSGNTIDMINAQGQNRWSPIKIPNIPQDTSLVNPEAKFNAGTNFLRYPAWAPGNHSVAFMAEGHSGLIVTTTDKGAQPTLHDFDYEGSYGRVFWSPDGGKLAYEVLPPSGIAQVAVLNLGSGNRTAFGNPHEGSAASNPSWGPDSSGIAYIQAIPSAETPAVPVGALMVADFLHPESAHAIVPSGASEPDWR